LKVEMDSQIQHRGCGNPLLVGHRALSLCLPVPLCLYVPGVASLFVARTVKCSKEQGSPKHKNLDFSPLFIEVSLLIVFMSFILLKVVPIV
ncbi:hypothetical protein Taro_014575, partial [Colocasia esculenta]|nr:hypothetical protein [Colocasia esculenta]